MLCRSCQMMPAFSVDGLHHFGVLTSLVHGVTIFIAPVKDAKIPGYFWVRILPSRML